MHLASARVTAHCAALRRVGPFLRRTVLVSVLGLIIANLGIAGLSLVLQAAAQDPGVVAEGVDNLRVVDDRVLRGDAPSEIGYRDLAQHGVTTVVDLRAERDLALPVELFDELGVDHVALPIRDGQTPTAGQVRRFLDVVDGAEGLVYVHCGAGVGRTGAMVAAYVVATGQQSRIGALHSNLAVGPPSVEQIYYAAFLQADGFDQPPAAIAAISRFLDAPRRMWSRYGL
jgi:protein-tyrosine phosphatase